MTHPAPFAAPAADPAPATPPTGGVRPAGAHWRGWPEVRADLRSSARLVAGLALAGAPTGLLWWALSPRADFRVTDAGPVPVGSVSEELLVADDVVYALLVLGVGLVAGGAAWFLRRRRGVATLLALALGSALTAVVAWLVGELLGAGPSEAELADVGATVTTSLTLGSWPAMALAPFGALLAYLVGVVSSTDDGLGRVEVPPAGSSPAREG
ncbi:UNVERIFIED_ORG: LPXTG cell wall anchor domain-containing protein [Bacillus sp. AZ43]